MNSVFSLSICISISYSISVRSRLAGLAMCTTAALAALPAHAQAQAQAQAPSPAQTLVVTGSREPLARHQVAADVVVIDAERIRNSGADSLEDLLRREAGLQLLRNGGAGQSAGLSIRGASRGQTLLLVDGVRVGSATLGTPELDTLTLAGIERIEVLRGPGSSLYGADALGGVVHIITRRAGARPAFSLRAAAGGYGAREASASGEVSGAGFDLALSLADERQRGTSALRAGDPFGNFNPDDDGYTRRTAAAQLGYTPREGHRIGLMLRGGQLNNQYDSSEFLPPTFAQDASGDFRNRVRDELVALDYRGKLAPAWTLTARLGDQNTRSVSGAAELSRFATRREQGALQLSHALTTTSQLTAALEQVDETASSTSYTADASRRNRAVVLAYAGGVPIDALSSLAVQAELRQDRNSAYGRSSTGRAGLRWALAEGWSLRTLSGNSFRAPSFNDLVFPGFGVPTLRPEKGRSVEVGLDWKGSGQDSTQGNDSAEAGFTVYRQNQRDLIGYEPSAARCPPDPAYVFGCASNVQSARLQGVSVNGRLPWMALTRAGSLAARLEWLDAADRATGLPLPRRAKQQASLVLTQQAGAARLAAELVHVGERPDSGATLPAYTTIDLLAAWRLAPALELQAKLLNATDRDVEPLLGYQALGRQAWLVLRWVGGW